MDFVAVMDQVIALLRQRGRLTYRTLQRQFQLDDAALDDLKDELIYGQRLAADEEGKVLVWSGETGTTAPTVGAPAGTPAPEPLAYTPSYLAEKILTSRRALEGERKQVTVLFADLKDSTELIRGLDPEAAQQLLDPAIHVMMDAVHRFEGTVNQVLGDGIMALFGAPIAHEDHALRACYAALAMQATMRAMTDDVRRTQGLELRMRVGLHSGEVVVRAIGNDLHMDYSAVGETTHLAARMEQLATPGSIRLTAAALRLVEGLVRVTALGPIPVKGLPEPVEVFELVGASGIRRRLQAAAARGLTRFVGRQRECDAIHQALARAAASHGQAVALVGEAGVGKSRLVYECVHSHHTQGWRVLESASVSYGKATPYFPVIDLLRRYCHVDDSDDARTIRAKVTGQVLTLDEALQETLPALLALLDALPADSPFARLDPPQRRQRTLDALKRVLLRESQVQPLLLVCEDLHWIDTETQALLDSLVESLPTARLLLLVNYRPEYQHIWGSKTSYTQICLDPLPPASADEFLQVLLGNDPRLVPLRRLLIARTAGNPFFLEESEWTLVETGVLVGERGAYHLGQPVQSIQVPATVQAVLAARIDRLPPTEKRLLQTAAVIGTEMPFALLEAIATLPEEALHRGLTHLQAAEFLYETRLFPELVYTFKHTLTQQVAYQSLLMRTRQQVHAQIAQVVAAHFPKLAETQPELLAHHCTEAGLTQPAVGYWRQAGEKAIQRSAYVEALSHLTTGLALLASLPATPERTTQELALQIALGPVLMTTKGQGAPEVAQAYARARALCQEVEATPQLFPVLRGLCGFYVIRSEFQTARELGEQLLTLAEQQPDPTCLIHAHQALGGVLFHLGELASARTHLEQAMALYADQPHRLPATAESDPGVVCQSYAARTLWLLGYPAQALQWSNAALALAQELAHPFSLAFAVAFAASVHQYRREAHATQERAEAAIALCTEQGFALFLAAGTIHWGWALATQGRSAEGLAQLRRGLDAWWATGAKLNQQYGPALLAEAYGAVGQIEAGLTVLAEALAGLDKTEERYWEAELHRLKGVLLLRQTVPDAPQAETCLYQALAIARRQQAKSLELRAALSLSRLWQHQGKRTEAYDVLASIYAWFTEGFDTADLQEAKALLAELEGNHG